MSATELLVDQAVLPDAVIAGARIAIADGRIAAVAASAGKPPLRGTLLPGFVDLQVNGAGGRSVDEATTEALDNVARAVFAGGAVAFLPTLITAPWERLLAQVAAVSAWIGRWNGQRNDASAEPLGLHVEGPFLDAPGVHDEAAFLDPTPARIDQLLAAADGRLRLVTLACSRKGAAAAVQKFRAAGVACAIGHVARTDGFAECVAAGASLVTHLFNVMGPLHHRDPGIPGLALDDERVSCPLIVDGAHVHPAMVRNAFKILGPDRTVLVTDAIAAAGMPDGEFDLAGRPVQARGGIVRDAEGRLAGSALTMARAAANFLQFVPMAGDWMLARAAATNPARLVGAEAYGVIARGRRAAFTLRQPDGTFAALRA